MHDISSDRKMLRRGGMRFFLMMFNIIMLAFTAYSVFVLENYIAAVLIRDVSAAAVLRSVLQLFMVLSGCFLFAGCIVMSAKESSKMIGISIVLFEVFELLNIAYVIFMSYWMGFAAGEKVPNIAVLVIYVLLFLSALPLMLFFFGLAGKKTAVIGAYVLTAACVSLLIISYICLHDSCSVLYGSFYDFTGFTSLMIVIELLITACITESRLLTVKKYIRPRY
jgi:hypothetical protein